LYQCFPKTLEVIRKNNPDTSIVIYYSFWDSEERLLDRKQVTGHADGEWATLSSENLTKDMTSRTQLNLFFTQLGCVIGKDQILALSVMDNVIKKTPFRNENKNNVSKLSSQYFQIQEAAALNPNPNPEDFCLRLRADIYLEDFPTLEDSPPGLIVNEFVWENNHYKGNASNEMVWLCRGKYFNSTCSLYSREAEYVDYRFGENVTGHFFIDLIRKKKIPEKIYSFNFRYRILR